MYIATCQEARGSPPSDFSLDLARHLLLISLAVLKPIDRYHVSVHHRQVILARRREFLFGGDNSASAIELLPVRFVAAFFLSVDTNGLGIVAFPRVRH